MTLANCSIRALRIGLLAAGCLGTAAHAAPLTFEVTLDAAVAEQPAAGATGRLVVYLIAPTSKLPRAAQPSSGPFFEDPQPMFGVDVLASGLVTGADAKVIVNDRATSFPVAPSKLPPGTYRAQAVLDRFHLDSEWRREPGNYFSDIVTFTIPEGNEPLNVALALTKKTEPPKASRVPGIGGDEKNLGGGGAEVFEVRSELLSRFHGRDVMLRAGVITPNSPPDPQNPERKFPAVYIIPGFGGNEREALGRVRARAEGQMSTPTRVELSRHSFEIVLGPESGNGHTLFADSDNNGPWGEALVTELIPALEAKYPLIREPSARFVTGHSSGGWSSLWLQLNYPETFGGCWSSAPDPVDFRRFQLVDLYADANFYVKPDSADDTSSYRGEGGENKMTIRQENLMEEVLGPGNSSAQQWDSWFAAFGPCEPVLPSPNAPSARRRAAPLFDPKTGAIEPMIAQHFRRYDIADLLRKDPQKYGPIFREKIRLLVGSADSFYLNEAVVMLQESLNSAYPQVTMEVLPGYIKVIEGADHGTLMGTPERRAFTKEMLDEFRKAGHIPPAKEEPLTPDRVLPPGHP